MTMITWALKRQILYISIFILFIATFAYLLIRPSLNKPPTCFDGLQNGTESGVDCGGSCIRACLAEVDPVSILWARVFKVVPGRYNAVAYLENHNKSVAAERVKYRFRFADENNIYIGKREGYTNIPPSGKFAVFEPAIDIGNSTPVYTTFEFSVVPDWKNVSKDRIDQLKISFSNIILSGEDSSPRLTATLKNNSLFTIPDFSVVTILYDKDRNAISASRTYLDELQNEESREITFTWPEAFSSSVVAKELIPTYDIFLANLK